MTDYKKDTGSSGEMMIRDTGSTVEFWLNSHNGSTFVNELPWGYTVNGNTNNNREFQYNAGSGWEKLDSWTVSTDQTVYFRIFNTGTSGFGGPTTLSAFINRASAPSKPSTPVASSITGSSMRIVWSDGANNGATIDARQVIRNTVNNVTAGSYFNVDNDTVFTGLVQGTSYYWWARTHNSKGWSPYSSYVIAKTLKIPDAPDAAILSDPSQVSVVASFTDNGNGGSTILERQIGHNTVNSTTGITLLPYTGVKTITGLQPATTYYFWARVRNSVGWSSYSPVASKRTIAGSYLNVGGVWTEAIPYTRDGGVWKLVRPWGRVAGVWKETI